MLSVCPLCLSVCNVGVLWPNGWMDQDATWYGGRPRPRPHCVRWGLSSPSDTMWPGPRSTSVPSGILIHPTVWPQYTNVTTRGEVGPHSSPPRKGAQQPPTFAVYRRRPYKLRPMSIVAKRQDRSGCHLVQR